MHTHSMEDDILTTATGNTMAVIGNEQEPDLYDEDTAMDENTQFSSYLPLYCPWLVDISNELHKLYPGSSVVGILPPTSFSEIGLPMYEIFKAIMEPPTRSGSIARYVLKIQTQTSSLFFLIKEVDPTYGENEVVIGNALTKLGFTNHFIPALFGVHGKGSQFRDDKDAYYVVVPWLQNSITLESFINNNKPGDLQLSTLEILKAFEPLLRDISQAWDAARFTHVDSKLNQVLVTLPLRLHLIDFGYSCINVTIDGKPYVVDLHLQPMSTEDFHSDTVYLIDYGLHPLISANSPAKNMALIAQWNKLRNKFRRSEQTLMELCN